MAVAKFGDAVYDEPDDEPVSREPTGATVDGAVSLSGVPRLSALAESIPAKGGLLFSWPLAKGVMAEVRLTGGDIRPGHIDMLRQYLALAKTALQDDEPEPTAPSVTGQPVNDDDEEAPE